MSLFGRLLAASTPAPAKTPVPLVSRAAGAFSGMRYNRGATAALGAMEAASVVFGIVDRLATSVSLVDWKLYKSAKSGKPEDREEVTSHLALDILNKPNEFFTRQSLMEAAQQHQELTGESWLVVSRNPRARTIPLELWPVRPDRMEPIPSPDSFIAGYEYRSPDGESVPLQRDDVLFVHRPDPNNAMRGLGPIRSTLTDIDSIRYSMEWNKNFFMNSAEPGGIVEIDRRLSDDEFDELVARWKEQHQGVAQAHRVAILEQVKWVDRKYTMRDMQFTELRGVTEAGIKLAFGFPKFALGEVDDVNRAQGEASIAMYAKWLIVPRLERWKGVFNRRFLPMFGSTTSGLEFDYVSPVTEDSEAENAARTSRVQAVASLVPLGFDAKATLKAFDLPDIPWEKPEPPAPPAGAFPSDELGEFGGPPPSDEVMAHAMRQILGHKPGGIDHDQSKHGWRKYNDDKLLAERLQRLRGDRPADDSDIYRAQVRLAHINLARDRANVLAEVEEVALINEGIDEPDALRRRLAFVNSRAGLDNDPRIKPLSTAVESGNRKRILKALASVAASSGLSRIGGNPEDGPDQLVVFDPAEHRNMLPGVPRRGQKMLLVRPGYRAEIDGETVLLEPAVVAVATLEDIRLASPIAHYPGGVDHGQWKHGRRKSRVPDDGERDAAPPKHSASRARPRQGRISRPRMQPPRMTPVDIAYAVRSGVAAEEPISRGDNGETALIRTNDGRLLFRKKVADTKFRTIKDQTDAEDLASRLGKAANANVPAIWVDGDTIYSEYMAGTVAANVSPARRAATVTTNAGKRLGLLDVMTEEWDRNWSNFLIDRSGNPVGIDHAFAFSHWPLGHTVRVGPDARVGTFSTFGGQFWNQFQTSPADGIRWTVDIPADEMRAVRERVRGLRQQFEARGREVWYQKAFAIIDTLTQVAEEAVR